MFLVKAGTTSFRGYWIRVLDSTTFLPYTGATSATAGASFGYTRPGSTRQSISLSDLAAVDSAYSSGGMKHVAAGWYRLDVPDLAIATGVDDVLIDGAFTSYVVISPRLQLTGFDPRTELTTAALANLDAAVSTRSTYAGGDTSGTTTLLTRVTALLQTKAEADTAHGLLATAAALATAQTSLNTIAAYIDTEIQTIITNIAALPAAVWDRLTSALTTVGSIGAWILANAGSGASPATFWAYASRTLTQGAASVASAVTGSAVTTYRGTRWSVSLTGLPSYSTSTYTSIIVAIKRSTEDTDADSIVYIRKNRTGSPADGLIYFDGITSPTAAHASITADSATAITIVVEGAATQYATPGQYSYGIKVLDASGYPVAESEGGSWIIAGETPRAVT